MDRSAALAVLAACLLLVPLAAAVLVEMPLAVEADKPAAKVGDVVTFDVSLLNESWKERLAGRTLRVEFTHDGSTQTDESAVGVVGDVTLDADAVGTFTWTVPESVDDKNVFVTIMDGEEGVGSAHVAVGDAPPIMFATGGAPPDGGAIDESGGEPVDDATNEREVPAGGAAFALLGVLAAAVAVVARRGR